MVIGEHPEIGIKALAQEKGVTAGTASQMIKKLIQKGLVRKQISAESEAKIELFLTEEGLICFEVHRKVHEEANQKWCKLFDELVTQIVTRMEVIPK